MQPCHTPAPLSAVFDEPNLIASAGLVPGVALADRIGLRGLAGEWVTVPGSTWSAGATVMSVVVGMLAGAESIDDLGLLRHGGRGTVFTHVRAQSTLGSLLRHSSSVMSGSWMQSPPGFTQSWSRSAPTSSPAPWRTYPRNPRPTPTVWPRP